MNKQLKHKIELGVAWALIIISIVGWVLSLLFSPTKEPIIESLSWAALLFAGVAALFAADD